jgi:acyl-CoA synthetase (NDP forming)/GNAT superfamily N-acetyltransferase
MKVSGRRARPTDAPNGYPAAWEVDSLLVDGRGVHLRPILPDDAERLERFHRGLSTESAQVRLFGSAANPTAVDFERLAHADYVDTMALIALVGDRLVGVARYFRLERSEDADVSFVVADEFQGHGVGTLLLEILAGYATEKGIGQFLADTLPENSEMLDVFEDAGMSEASRLVEGVVRVRLDLTPTASYLARREERERVATAASVASFLRPSSIAVIGAGRHPGGIGHEIVRSLLAGDFAGIVYPVNPHARSICGVRAYASVGELPPPVDLGVVAVPPSAVLQVVEESAAAGLRSLVIITSGFGETGHDGASLENELLDVARHAGMRIVGPNCLGVSSTDPDVRCNATFSPVAPVRGRVGLFTQSGAVGIVLLEECSRAGIGVSNFVSVGNKIDVSGNDLLCFWEDDPATEVIALYLESFGNPRKFLRTARRVARKQPIVALKAGRTVAGVRGARSHTAAAATPAVASDALLSAAGVIAVEGLDELLDVVALVGAAPLPRGPRVALVGNSGGPLILAADACTKAGLVVPEFSKTTQRALREVLNPASAVANPVDTTAGGGEADLVSGLRVALGAEDVDAAIAVVTPLISLSREQTLDAIDRVARESDKPIIACIFGEPIPAEIDRLSSSRFTVVPSPDRAAAAMERASTYAEWRSRPASPPADPAGVDVVAARGIVTEFLSDNPAGGWLDVGRMGGVLKAFGIACAEMVTARSLEQALAAARQVGYPVALKAEGATILHKTEVGGVALGLGSEEELAAAYRTMADRLGRQLEAVAVQRMIAAGVETIVGLSVDPDFGPLLMFGLGGIVTELLGDHEFAVPPLSEDDSARLVAAIRGAPLLYGYRGSEPVAIDQLRDVLNRVSCIAEKLPEVVELDLNPVIATPREAIAVDFRLRVAPQPPGRDAYMRILRRRPVQPVA